MLNIFKYMNKFHLKRKLFKSGFTMIELVMGIPLLLLLLAFVAVSIWDTIYTFRLSAASANVLHDIRFAQQLAMNQNTWHGIEFSADPLNQYHVYTTNGVQDSDVPNPANRAEPLVVNVNNLFGVKIEMIDIGGGSKVEFNPMGKPYLDKNGSSLSEEASVVLSCGGKNRTIHILKDTGRSEML